MPPDDATPGADADHGDPGSDWYLEQLRVPETVVGPDGREDFSYASIGDLLLGGAVTHDGIRVDVGLLVHDGGVVAQLSRSAAATLSSSRGMPWLAERLGLRPVTDGDAGSVAAGPDRVWVQATQGPNAVLVLRPDEDSTVYLGLGRLPETLRVQLALLGILRLDLVLGDEPLLPTLTGRGLAALAAESRAWSAQVAATDGG